MNIFWFMHPWLPFITGGGGGGTSSTSPATTTGGPTAGPFDFIVGDAAYTPDPGGGVNFTVED